MGRYFGKYSCGARIGVRHLRRGAGFEFACAAATVATYCVAIITFLAKFRLHDSVTANLTFALTAASVAVDQIAIVTLFSGFNFSIAADSRPVSDN